MRLHSISTKKRRLKHRILLRIISFFSRTKTPDVLKLLTYRTDYFGAPFSQLTHKVLRGESCWSVGHRELFAAFTSKVSNCPF